MPDPGVLAVVYGGPSAEHEVSCISARRIVASALQSGFTVKVIGLTHDKQWVDANRVLTGVADVGALPSPDDLFRQDPGLAVAHLGGAMGKPVFLLVKHVPDWRWMLEREDSPWYPTIRLFRQRDATDWTSTIERVAGALEQFVVS